MAGTDDIIGQGWSFPPRFDLRRATVELRSGVADIHDSLYILFTTALGERLMQPKYGCSLHTELMEPLNSGKLAYLRNLLETAILYHEPRIDAEQILFDVESEPGLLRIELRYKLRGSNSRFNFVYPFYLQEGSRA